jgi:vacuolar-type H+-ATPase subunit E/Vma4
MSLKNILEALEADAERQVVEIEQATQAEIERIRTQAQAEAEVVQQKRMAAIQTPLQAEQARILNQAKLEALQIVMGTREALITSALEATAHRLAEMPTTGAYAGVLQQLTREAIDMLGMDGRLCLHVQSCNIELMRRIVQEMGLSATVAGGLENENSSPNCLGGVVVTTPDGCISLANTLEARLQRVASLYRARIARMVFGDEQEG